MSDSAPPSTHGDLHGRVALVTGSGRNIGRAIARTLAGRGAAVVVNGSRDQEAVQGVVDEITDAGGRAVGLMADVSDYDAVVQLAAEAEQALGPIDIAVNNVGVRRAMGFEEITPEIWRSVMSTNLDSSFYVDSVVVPGMRERGWGRVIHISGYDGWTGHIHRRAANVTAKAAMHGLTKAVAREYGEHGLTANTIAVGAIQTQRDVSQYAHLDLDAIRERIPSHEFGSAYDISEACAYLCGPNSSFVNGQVIHVNGGEFMF